MSDTTEDVVFEAHSLLIEAHVAFAALAVLLENASDSSLLVDQGNMLDEQLAGASTLALAMRAKLITAAEELENAQRRQRQRAADEQVPSP